MIHVAGISSNDAETKWPPFCKRYFHFLVWNLLNSSFTKVQWGEAGRRCRRERLCRCGNITCRRISTALGTAGKNARVDESTWHAASSIPVKSLPVVYKMSSRTISRMSKMCVYRQIFMIWAPAVDETSGHNSLWCYALNCKINTTLWP